MNPNTVGSGWNSGHHAPGWIQVNCKEPKYVDTLTLVTCLWSYLQDWSWCWFKHPKNTQHHCPTSG